MPVVRLKPVLDATSNVHGMLAYVVTASHHNAQGSRCFQCCGC